MVVFYLCPQPSSPVDEIVDKLQEAVVAVAGGEDPAELKKKLMGDATSAAATAITEATS